MSRRCCPPPRTSSDRDELWQRCPRNVVRTRALAWARQRPEICSCRSRRGRLKTRLGEPSSRQECPQKPRCRPRVRLFGHVPVFGSLFDRTRRLMPLAASLDLCTRLPSVSLAIPPPLSEAPVPVCRGSIPESRFSSMPSLLLAGCVRHREEGTKRRPVSASASGAVRNRDVTSSGIVRVRSGVREIRLASRQPHVIPLTAWATFS